MMLSEHNNNYYYSNQTIRRPRVITKKETEEGLPPKQLTNT